MLDAIFGSAVRVKILNFLLISPAAKHYSSQLSTALGIAASSLRHELANLVKAGLIREDKDGSGSGKNRERKTYSINENFLLYPEIKALFVKAQILFSEKFLEGLRKACQPKFLALTGLFTNYPEAQTDLIVAGQIRRGPFLRLINELEADLGREVKFTILSEAEFLYRRDIMDIFLYNILEGKTVVLIDEISSRTDEPRAESNVKSHEADS